MTDRVALNMIVATISNYAPELRGDLIEAISYYDEFAILPELRPDRAEGRKRLVALLDALTEGFDHSAFEVAS
jgi:hypothetical protein